MSGNQMGGHGYGVLMLTRQQCYFYEKKFSDTGMSRSLLIGEPLGNDFAVTTAHFESLGFPKKRKSQMDESFEILKASGVPNTITVGDYNFDSRTKEEESVLTDSGMEDVVHTFHSRDAFTMP